MKHRERAIPQIRVETLDQLLADNESAAQSPHLRLISGALQRARLRAALLDLKIALNGIRFLEKILGTII